MQVAINPKPVQAGNVYTLTPSGGTSPYSYMPQQGNPPGVTIVVVDGVAEVTVPAGTPSGAKIRIVVSDSSVPPQTTLTTNHVS